MPMRSDPRQHVSHAVAPLTRWVRGATVAASALAATVALAACGVPSLPGRSTPDPSGAAASQPAPRAAASGLVPRETALKSLSDLTVAPARSMKGYDRDRFPHWTEHSDGCSTRDLVLKRDGRKVKSTPDCKITSGSWHSPYEDKTFDSPRDIDIDHVVPLANAWRSGADSWSDARRSEFANDLIRPQLIAVSASTNRGKGDKDPSEWQPPNRDSWCWYAQRWVVVKSHWRLTITTAEESRLSAMLRGCR
jgi:hypothetical protein